MSSIVNRGELYILENENDSPFYFMLYIGLGRSTCICYDLSHTRHHLGIRIIFNNQTNYTSYHRISAIEYTSEVKII